MKKYLVAFASVLAFSAPVMASEQAIEFMNDAQLSELNGAKFVIVRPDATFGSLETEVGHDQVWTWVSSVGKGNITIDGETFTTIDSLGMPIESRIKELKAKISMMGASQTKYIVDSVDAKLTIVTGEVAPTPAPSKPRPIRRFVGNLLGR